MLYPIRRNISNAMNANIKNFEAELSDRAENLESEGAAMIQVPDEGLMEAAGSGIKRFNSR